MPPTPAPLLRIGTRGSPLALAQAHQVQARLAAALAVEASAIALEIIKTTGDAIQNRPLTEIGGKGLFVKVIEQALVDGAIDLAVHSAKDVPGVLPDGLVLAACLPREDARDAFISRRAANFAALAPGAVVGTASPRRAAMVKRLRGDLTVVPLRGNVETRLKKLDAGDFDATLLAMAGLNRLGLAAAATAPLDVDDFLPAVGQGAIALVTRAERRAHAHAPCEDRRCRRRDRARRRARVSRRARRLLPHADRRPCAPRRRCAAPARPDREARRQQIVRDRAPRRGRCRGARRGRRPRAARPGGRGFFRGVKMCVELTRRVHLLPSRPLAGRVGCRRIATADGVGGLRLLRICKDTLTHLRSTRGAPTPTPPRHALRARGEGRRRAMRLLVTRPEADAAGTAAALRARGHDVMLAPLLSIEPEVEADLGSGPWGGVLITSANAVRAVTAHPRKDEFLRLPLFAVGRRSAAAARAAGFAEVVSADGDAADLAQLVAARDRTPQARVRARLPLLYLAGEDRAGDLGGALAAHGIATRTVVVYRAVIATALPPDIKEALAARRIHAVLDYSRRSADAFVALALAALIDIKMLTIKHYCVSAQTAEPLREAGATALAAATPDEAALLALIDAA